MLKLGGQAFALATVTMTATQSVIFLHIPVIWETLSHINVFKV